MGKRYGTVATLALAITALDERWTVAEAAGISRDEFIQMFTDILDNGPYEDEDYIGRLDQAIAARPPTWSP